MFSIRLQRTIFLPRTVLLLLLFLAAPFAKNEFVSRAVSAQSAASPQTAETGDRSAESNKNESQKNESKPLEPFKIALAMLGGLALFLYGVSRLAEALEKIASDKMRDLLAKFTTNRFAAVGTGAAATTLLDSSSVTIIIVIALVNAGLLKFAQALGVIMGSNIGTTVSSQLYAFDVDEYAPIALLIGFLLHVLTKSERWRTIGLIVLSVGLIFFGLHLMGEAVKPLRDYEPFLAWMKNLETPIYGAVVGCLATILIQSSSATLGIVIALASQNLIALPAAIAVMLGSEVGTCADTVVAAIGRSREAVRAAIFHLFFNLTTAALGLVFVNQLVALAAWLAFGAGTARQIANAHVLFNVLGVLLFINFTDWIARFLGWLVPSGGEQPKEPNAENNGQAQARQTK